MRPLGARVAVRNGVDLQAIVEVAGDHKSPIGSHISNCLSTVGIRGFVPGINQPPPAGSPTLAVNAFYAFLLSLFAINLLHNLFHIVVGLIGVGVSRSPTSAVLYCRVLAVVFLLLTVFGLLPVLNTTFGLIPLFGLDVALHAVTAVALAYFGWFAARAPDLVGAAP